MEESKLSRTLRQTIHKDEVENYEKVMMSNRDKLYHFLSSYFICDTVGRKLVVSIDIEQSELRLIDVKKAIKHFGLSIDDNVLKAIFSKEKILNKRSCKFLRNQLVHGLSKSAASEIVRRNSELLNYMNVFLEIFK